MFKRRTLTFALGLVVVQGLIIIGATIGFRQSPSTETASLIEANTEGLQSQNNPNENSTFIRSATDKPLTPPQGVQGKLQWGNKSIMPTEGTESLPEKGVEIPSIAYENGLLPLAYKVKNGDTLSGIWKEIGGTSEQIPAATKAFRKADVALSSIRAGETLEFTVDVKGQVQSFKKPLREGKVLVLTSLKDGGFKEEIIHPKIVETERNVKGDITTSLAEAAVQQGVPYEVVDEFVDLFGGRVEFSRDVHRGDSFTVIFDERNAEDGATLSPGPIQAASFMNKGELLVAIRYDTPDGPSYYDQKGNPLGNHFLRYPVKYTRISSMFTKARFHPVLKRMRPHNGVDFAAPTGTPVRSVADGVVTNSTYHRANGNWVKIKHGDKYATAYLHLSKISKGVRVGSRVKRGQVIGAVGSTGLSTGPHLHYSFYVNGKYVDPMRVKLPTVPEKFHKIPEKVLKPTLRKLKRQHKELKLASNELVKNQETV